MSDLPTAQAEWYGGALPAGVQFHLNDAVRIARNGAAIELGCVISLEQVHPMVSYVVETSDGRLVNAVQSELHAL